MNGCCLKQAQDFKSSEDQPYLIWPKRVCSTRKSLVCGFLSPPTGYTISLFKVLFSILDRLSFLERKPLKG